MRHGERGIADGGSAALAVLNLVFVHNALLHDEVDPLKHADIG